MIHPTNSVETNRRSNAVPKLCGADVEVANVVRGIDGPRNTAAIASRALLREIPGVAHSRWAAGHHVPMVDGDSSPYYSCSYTTGGQVISHSGAKASQFSQSNAYFYDSQDWGRRYLASNGGCAYIDLHHLELCIPEVLSARDFVAAWHAMLLVARSAMDRANAGAGTARIQVLVNNSDGQGNSYGSHLNFLLARDAWENIFDRKPHHMAFLASYQASSIVFTGQGKVGAENDAPAVPYQLSQRADFFERLTGLQTTYERPLVNSRDEAHCGGPRYANQAVGGHPVLRVRPDYARLHCIFYDSNLCHVACLLKVGVMQIILAMLECDEVNPELLLDDPVDAVGRFSRDPGLKARARMASGKYLTAVELQLLFLDEAARFCAAGGCDGVVPHAGEILSLYADTLQKLRAGNLDALAPRLDWVLKLRILQRAMANRPNLNWNSPEIKLLDHLYSSLDPSEGLYWLYEKAGVTEAVASPAEIERFVHEPPADTRAYARAMLLRMAQPDQISSVNWDSITFKFPGRWGWPVQRTFEMSDPLAFTEADTARIFASGEPLETILADLKNHDVPESGTPEAPDVPDNAEDQLVLTAEPPRDSPLLQHTSLGPHPACPDGEQG